MLFQIALDIKTVEAAIPIVEQVKDYVDILEIGTGFVKNEGLEAVRQMRAKYPDKLILADLKTMDVGYSEANLAFLAGADLVTVLGVAYDSTIEGAIRAAREHKKEVVVDLIGVAEQPKRAAEAEALGADYACAHTAHDILAQGFTPLDDLLAIKAVLKKTKSVMTGGINLDNIEKMVTGKPDVMIVGSGLCKAENPGETAKQMRAIMDRV